MRKTSVSLVHFVFVIKISGFASLRLKIPLGNLIPPKILHQSSIDTPSILHRSDGPSMEYRWSILYGKRENVWLSPLGGKKIFRLRGETKKAN